jgi:membrane dipeptidase
VIDSSLTSRLTSLHRLGIADLHFDLPMYLYEERERSDILASEFLPAFEIGGIRLIVAAIYLEDRYLPERGLEVALGQIARLEAEVERCQRFAICKSHPDIDSARAAGKVAIIIGLEGAEPLGTDLDRVRLFYEKGLRLIGLTHARRNAAAAGAAFVVNASSRDGLTDFGRDLVRECERLGIIIDLAHINPAGFDEILAMTSRPPMISHTNVRKFYDIDRNASDEQICAIGRRDGIVGINSILVSPDKAEATVDRFVDHVEHVIELIGIDGVGIGFDFIEFMYRHWSEEARAEFHQKFPHVHFIPDLTSHDRALNVVRKLIERGFSNEEIEKILSGNAMRFFEQVL